MVSGHLQKEADFFMNFVEGGRTMKEFCNQVRIQLSNLLLSSFGVIPNADKIVYWHDSLFVVI